MVCVIFSQNKRRDMTLSSGEILGDVMHGRKDLYLTLTPPRLAFTGVIFSLKGAKAITQNLQPRLKNLLYQGQYLHHILSFLQDREQERGKDFPVFLLTTLRALCGLKSVQAWGRALTTMKSLKPLKLFAFDSVSKQAPRGQEAKLRVWATSSTLVYQIGRDKGLFTEMEDALLNPLNPTVVWSLLLADTEPDDYAFVDLFGRSGILYIANRIGTACLGVLDHYLRDLSRQFIATTAVMNLVRQRRNVEFNDVRELETRLRTMIEYNRQEQRRGYLNDTTAPAQSLERVALLTLLQVC